MLLLNQILRAKRTLIVLLCISRFIPSLFFPGSGFPGVLAQPGEIQHNIDSLENLLTDAAGINKYEILLSIAGIYININTYKSLQYRKKALSLAKELGEKPRIAESLNIVGYTYSLRQNYKKALDYYLEANKICDALADSPDETIRRTGKEGISSSLQKIGIIYHRQSNYKKALEYLFESLGIDKELGYKEGDPITLVTIGDVYTFQGNYVKSSDYYQKALNIYKEQEYKLGIAHSFASIGTLYYLQNKKRKAKEYYQQSLNILEELEDKRVITNVFNNLATIYEDWHNYPKALAYYQRGLAIAKEIGEKRMTKSIYESLAILYFKMGEAGKSGRAENFKQAYQYYELFTQVKDSIFTEQSNRYIAEIGEKYESEKKEKEIKIQKLEISQKSAEVNKQRVIIWAGAGGLLLVIVLAFFIYRGYRQKQVANMKLERKNTTITRQKKQIEIQKAIVEQKNKDITDSIFYAQHIQQAILPAKELIRELLPESFTLLKPKDIVSGDFYWLAGVHPQSASSHLGKAGDGLVIWAVVDCTGHGVPGAFMSMIGNSLLDEIVIENGVTEADRILNRLREHIIKALGQKGVTGEQQDGMDIALCKINAVNGHARSIQFAGAYNPLWIVRKGELIEIKGDKQPIGIYEKIAPFTKHEIALKKGDMLYTFSDGYADQFGGDSKGEYGEGQKFMKGKFKKLLLSIHDKPMEQQKQILDKTIEKWRGNIEQGDDICVVGVRV